MAIVNIERCPYPTPITGKVAESKEKSLVNGSFVAVGKNASNNDRDVYEIKKLSDKARVGVVAEPFHPYIASDKEDDMVFKENDLVRVYLPQKGDQFAVSKKDCIQGAVAIGDALKLNNDSYKLTKDATSTAPVAFVADIYTLSGTTQESVVVEFI